MKEILALDNANLKQGIYLPSNEEVPVLLKEAEMMAAHVIEEVSRLLAKRTEEATSERDRVVRHFANITALGALASTHLSFQALVVQQALHALVHRHTAALREFFFQNGARDADVLFEKYGPELTKKETES